MGGSLADGVTSLDGSAAVRREKDLLGDREIPSDVYWGIHTLRALENFRLQGDSVGSHRDFVAALGRVKKAAALANADVGELDPAVAGAIVAACDRVIAGELDDQFPLSLLQGGAGTSTNMNANEVIANAALEHLGLPRGEYSLVSPNEHVNRGQSTNDVYPTAVKLATIALVDDLIVALLRLRDAFTAKAEEFRDVGKVGRTQLQDAVPMTLGQEFSAYAALVDDDVDRLREATRHLHEISLGGTAIGTGINAHPGYADAVLDHLRTIASRPLTRAANLMAATSDAGGFVLVSGTVKRAAIRLSKICNDLRLLSSGPRAGLGELTLPPRQAGSSIMPGKVNPVVPELVNQVAFEIVGVDATVTFAAEAGQLQLNAFEPVIAAGLFRGLAHLTIAAESLSVDCVTGITANSAHMAAVLQGSLAPATALATLIGYATASEIAREATTSGLRLGDVIVARGVMDRAQIAALLAAMP